MGVDVFNDSTQETLTFLQKENYYIITKMDRVQARVVQDIETSSQETTFKRNKKTTKTAPDTDRTERALEFALYPKDVLRLFTCGGKLKSSCKCARKEPKDRLQKVDVDPVSSEFYGYTSTSGEHEASSSGNSQNVSCIKFLTIADLKNELTICDTELARDTMKCKMCKTFFHESHIAGPSSCKAKFDDLPYCDECQIWVPPEDTSSCDDLDGASQHDEKGSIDGRECIVQDSQKSPCTVTADRVTTIEDAEFARPVASDASMPSNNALIYCPICHLWLEN